MSSIQTEEKLALLGGSKTVAEGTGDIFAWPIITDEDEAAVLDVLRRGAMSGTDVTRQFETEYAAWHEVEFALGFSSGTASIHSAMWACGVGAGDEIIAPSLTFWASAAQALNLGASVVFAEVDPDTFCIDPNDIEHRITERTQAIVAVHYSGHPCDMDPIMEIAEEHGLKVIEDVSHAHGGLYQGRRVGTIGHVGAMSLMSGKALAIGEAGILITNDRAIYERAVAFGHYERTAAVLHVDAPTVIRDPELRRFAGIPLGGFKYRMHQLSSAVGRVQLRHYADRMAEIQKAMNYFWDLLEGVPGLRAHRPDPESGSTMGGWYFPLGHYRPEQLGGLSIQRFCDAIRAEGSKAGAGANRPLHLHPFFREADVYGRRLGPGPVLPRGSLESGATGPLILPRGKVESKASNTVKAGTRKGGSSPPVKAGTKRQRWQHRPTNQPSVRQGPGSLPVTESLPERIVQIPWFKHCRRDVIEQHAAAWRKVAQNAVLLLD